MLPQMMAGFKSASPPVWVGASGQGTFALLRHYPALIPVQVVYMGALALIYFLFFKGIFILWQGSKRLHAVFLLIGALYFLAIAAHQGYYRFRIPMMPFLAAGAAWGIRQQRREGRS